jgi:hypothetical protein
LKKLAGNPPDVYGTAKEFFDEKGLNGAEVRLSLQSLIL